MRELLLLRAGPASVLALLVVVGLPLLIAVYRFLDRSGRLPRAASSRQRSLRTDLGFVLLAPFTEVASRTLTTLGIAGCALALGLHVGPELLDGFGPVSRQPRWLMILEMLVLSDFVYYWTHRMAHELPWLWRLHAVHHSTQELRCVSALRAHPAEVYSHLVNTLPLFLLGFPIDALAVLAPIVTLYALAIHAHVNVALRPVAYLVNTPLFHGWHHARDVRHGTVNFAGLFPVFDLMFGTYRLPRELPCNVGVDDPSMPETLVAQLAHPFRGEERAHGGSLLPL